MALTDGLIHGWNLNNDLLDAFGAADGTDEGLYFTTPAPLGSHQGEGNGIDDYARFGDIANFDYDEPFSVSFILSPKDMIGAQVLITKMTSGNVGWDIYLSSAIMFFRIAQVWSSKAFQVQQVGLTTTETHYVVTYNGSNTVAGLKIYKSAVEGAGLSVNNPMDGTIVNNEEFTLLARNGGAFPSNVKMDAVYLWNRDITQSEVTELHNGGNYLELTSGGIFVPRSYLNSMMGDL